MDGGLNTLRRRDFRADAAAVAGAAVLAACGGGGAPPRPAVATATDTTVTAGNPVVPGPTATSTGAETPVAPTMTTAPRPSTATATRPAPTPPPATPIATAAPLPAAARLAAYLQQAATGQHFSGTALVARDGGRFVGAYGLADRAAGVPNTPATMFRLGSVTKQFTAMAVLILAQRGLLDVHDPVCRYLADCPVAWAPITLEHLLTHTSGIPDYINSPAFVAAWPPKDATPEQLVAEFRDWSLDFPPGARMQYSNSGYVLLGYVIERVTGRPYADYLQSAIFDPLGMANSGFDTTAIRPGHAQGYYADGTEPEPYAMSAVYAAGALYSTVGDMARWDDALERGALISPALMQAMFTPRAPCPPPGSRGGCLMATDAGYGYGWFIAHEPQGTLRYHVGHIDGYFSFNGLYAEPRLHVVVLSNAEGADILGIGRALAAIALAPPA
ncbi:MAG TPA: serine hydrolase domain-containing protein [Thermomicrobiales bacterium]|nr:serine hydrolase domain-containing protein [Thermomicrobiales bacterium]